MEVKVTLDLFWNSALRKWEGGYYYHRVHNNIDTIDLRVWPPKTPGLDSGLRRRDELEAPSLLSFRGKPESNGIKQEFDVYKIMALLISWVYNSTG